MKTISILGRIGRDPELRYTGKGTAVTNLSIAVNERQYNAQTREYEDRAVWFRVTAYGKQAETISQHFKKGQLFCGSGELSVSEYTNKEGRSAYTLQVTLQTFSFVPTGNGNGNGDAAQTSGPTAPQPGQAPAGKQPAPPAPAPAADFDPFGDDPLDDLGF